MINKLKKLLIEKKRLEAFIFLKDPYRGFYKKYSKLTKVISLFSLTSNLNNSRALLLKDGPSTLIRDDELKYLVNEEVSKISNKIKVTLNSISTFFTKNKVYSRERGSSIIIEIRAGTGGEEASLFVNKLYRMYVKYITTLNIKYEKLHFAVSDKGGFRYICFRVFKNLSEFLNYESGVHRIQRVPVTENNGRVHTSTATVAVLPEADEVEVILNDQDLKITVCKSSGPGGQGVNTTDSAVQIIHKPTGLTSTCSDQRTQQKNKTQALSVLRARLFNLKKERSEREYSDVRRKQIGLGLRSEKVRTYNFTKNRITDHRTNTTMYLLEKVMAGDMDELYSKMLNDK
ncbi:MAG: PCRF domain-containing protein [Candidatus Organicella extenuata]|uniref:PCRF domain-containing protein n=1 Tax=Candidatus Organicella extenuata TaxID=2841811 RepID=A0AA51GEM2_9BACT|nr:MAG: PCRF domain-containing protein [Candidatus Organicella extenuata]